MRKVVTEDAAGVDRQAQEKKFFYGIVKTNDKLKKFSTHHRGTCDLIDQRSVK